MVLIIWDNRHFKLNVVCKKYELFSSQTDIPTPVIYFKMFVNCSNRWWPI